MIRNFYNLGYFLLRSGFRVPKPRSVSRFYQQGRFVDLLNDLKINCFLDVGANNGEYARNIRKLGFQGHIFSFEPILDEFQILSRLSEPDDRWTPLNFALGNENSSKRLKIIKEEENESTVFSSFHSPMSGLEIDRVETVEIRQLDRILPNLLSPVDGPRIFIKSDTQGYDLEVFKGASESMHLVLGIQSEISVTPIYQNMPHFTEALAFYENLGFSLLDLVVVNRTPKRSVLEYDCVMARLDELP